MSLIEKISARVQQSYEELSPTVGALMSHLEKLENREQTDHELRRPDVEMIPVALSCCKHLTKVVLDQHELLTVICKTLLNQHVMMHNNNDAIGHLIEESDKREEKY